MSIAQNKALVRRYFDEFHTGRATSILEEIMAPDLLAPTHAVTTRLGTAFPDYELTIVEQIAEGDTVATLWTGRGTHRGEWASPIGPIAPTGAPVTWTGTTTVRVRGGKIAEVLGTNWDHLGILQQLGALPTAEPRSGA